jgi:hypothetical protein
MTHESIIAKPKFDTTRRYKSKYLFEAMMGIEARRGLEAMRVLEARRVIEARAGLEARDVLEASYVLEARDELEAMDELEARRELEAMDGSTENKLEKISKTVAEYMDNLRNVKEHDKIYFGKDKKIYIDGCSIFKPITRTFLFRNRYNTIEELEKLFKSYFILVDNIFANEKENDALINFHAILIDEWVKGMANLKFTYEESRTFRARADILMIKLLSIRRDIRDLNYKNMHVRSYSC